MSIVDFIDWLSSVGIILCIPPLCVAFWHLYIHWVFLLGIANIMNICLLKKIDDLCSYLLKNDKKPLNMGWNFYLLIPEKTTS